VYIDQVVEINRDVTNNSPKLKTKSEAREESLEYRKERERTRRFFGW